jgi:hypothetical protein
MALPNRAPHTVELMMMRLAVVAASVALLTALSPKPVSARTCMREPVIMHASVQLGNAPRRSRAVPFPRARAQHNTLVKSKAKTNTVTSHTTSPDNDGSCGNDGQVACTNDDLDGNTVHSCSSGGHPTIGAIISTEGTYMCGPCGEPGVAACECTHDNPFNPMQHTVDRFIRPCQGSMTHWCRFQPQYIAAVETVGYRFKCTHNDTGTRSTRG